MVIQMTFLISWTKIQDIKEIISHKVAELYERRRLQIEDQVRRGLRDGHLYKNTRKISTLTKDTSDTRETDTTRRVLESWAGMDFDISDEGESNEDENSTLEQTQAQEG